MAWVEGVRLWTMIPGTEDWREKQGREEGQDTGVSSCWSLLGNQGLNLTGIQGQRGIRPRIFLSEERKKGAFFHLFHPPLSNLPHEALTPPHLAVHTRVPHGFLQVSHWEQKARDLSSLLGQAALGLLLHECGGGSNG